MHYPFFIAESPLSGGSNLAAILVRSMRCSSKKTRAGAIFGTLEEESQTRPEWIKIGCKDLVVHLLGSGVGITGDRRHSLVPSSRAAAKRAFGFTPWPALRRGGRMFLAILLFASAGCGPNANREIAERILDRYRSSTGAKPLPASHVIRMRLRPEGGTGGAQGVAEIAWEQDHYRERVSSAGVTTERGIQAGKAYYIDEDGVTRVASEPLLRELLSRSYFWRRAWLFEDRGKAHLALGPADASSVSTRVTPLGANPIVLSFSRHDGRLVSVRSPRLELDFVNARAFRETSAGRPPVRVEIAWIGLPTGRLPDASVGGGCGRFGAAAPFVTFERTDEGGVSFPARLNGVGLRLSLDAAAAGPTGISAEKAKELQLSSSRDVYGRAMAGGATIEVGGFSCAGLHVEVLDSAPAGSDGVVGGTLFREAIVELDPATGRLGLHDPARWVSAAGFYRIIVDDDGNRPVTTFRRRAAAARLLLGSAIGASDLLLAPAAAQRLGVAAGGQVTDLRWGPLTLPPLSAGTETGRASPDWGDDGRIGFGFLLRFHSYLDMPHRWVYLRPLEPPGTR